MNHPTGKPHVAHPHAPTATQEHVAKARKHAYEPVTPVADNETDCQRAVRAAAIARNAEIDRLEAEDAARKTK